MEIKVKTNPSPNQTNPNNVNFQSQKTNPNNIMELQKQIEYLQQQLQQLQKQQNPQPQQNDTGEFIVKASMKSSVIALRIENLFLEGKKKIIMSGLGYAVPILIDAVMLIRKDMSKRVSIYV